MLFITYRANRGFLFADYHDALSDKEIKKLEQLGYKVFNNNGYYSIEWIDVK